MFKKSDVRKMKKKVLVKKVCSEIQKKFEYTDETFEAYFKRLPAKLEILLKVYLIKREIDNGGISQAIVNDFSSSIIKCVDQDFIQLNMNGLHVLFTQIINVIDDLENVEEEILEKWDNQFFIEEELLDEALCMLILENAEEINSYLFDERT